MSVEDLRSERIKNLVDALSFKEPEKVPVGAEIISWPFSYAGVSYVDIMDDPQAVADAYLKFLDVIELDFLWGGGLNTPVKAVQALGNTSYRIADDGVTAQHVQAELDFMTADEYPELIANPDAFALKRQRATMPILDLPRDQAYAKVIEALKEFDTFSQANALIQKFIFEDKQIIPLTGAPVGFQTPLNTLFDSYRGMRDTLLDLKRRPETVREVFDLLMIKARERMAGLDPKDFTDPYPLGMTGYHVECFLSPPLFDEYFFDPFMELCLPYMEAGLKFFIKGEGHFLNTIDRYRKLPKGSCVFMLDQDDPFEAYKAIGDWQSLATGITVDLLQTGSVSQCVDFVKRSFDTFAPGGGFIFMQNKPLLCGDDAKAENLIAAYETANELSLQK